MTKKLSKIIANNMTLVNTEDNNQGLVGEAVHINERSYFNLNNSIVDGFRSVVLLESKIGTIATNLAKINMQNIQINRCKGVVQSENPVLNTELSNWYNSDTFSLDITNINDAELFIQPDIRDLPDLRTKKMETFASVK
jgi:hypothetical protein